MERCHYCGEPKDGEDLRPYGPAGALECFDCALATPERRRLTEAMFDQQLEACGGVAVIGTGVGPFPLVRGRD